MEELVALIAPLVATVILAARQYLQARLTPERLAAVSQLARVAVDAADEVSHAADGIQPGEKFQYAETFLKQASKRVGVKLTNEEANVFIHAVLTGKRATLEDAVNSALSQILDAADVEELAPARPEGE